LKPWFRNGRPWPGNGPKNHRRRRRRRKKKKKKKDVQ
jgi:hypothetical protein